MNNLIRYFFTEVLLLTGIISVAQQNGFDLKKLIPSANSSDGKITGDIIYIDPYTNANHFLYSDWRKGTIFLEGGSSHKNVYLKYNAFNDQVVIYNDLVKAPLVADKEIVEQFEIIDPVEGIKVFRKLFSATDSKQVRYYRVLYEGSHLLVAFHKIIETKTSLHKDVFGILRDSEFRKTITYFLFNPSSGSKKILHGRKSFLSISPVEKSIAKNLFRENRIRKFNENEMVRAVELLEKEGILK